MKGPTAPYDGYDEREETEEKVTQALAFLQVLFYFLKNRDLNKLPTNSRKKLDSHPLALYHKNRPMVENIEWKQKLKYGARGRYEK